MLISFRNALPICAMPNGGRLARGGLDAQEVHEDPLGRLRPQVDHGAGILHRPDEGLEHQVELPRLGELPFRLAFVGLAPLEGGIAARGILDLIRAEPRLAFLAVDHRVGEVLDVP